MLFPPPRGRLSESLEASLQVSPSLRLGGLYITAPLALKDLLSGRPFSFDTMEASCHDRPLST